MFCMTYASIMQLPGQVCYMRSHHSEETAVALPGAFNDPFVSRVPQPQRQQLSRYQNSACTCTRGGTLGARSIYSYCQFSLTAFRRDRSGFKGYKVGAHHPGSAAAAHVPCQLPNILRSPSHHLKSPDIHVFHAKALQSERVHSLRGRCDSILLPWYVVSLVA